MPAERIAEVKVAGFEQEFWEAVSLVAKVSCLIFGLFPVWLIVGPLHSGAIILAYVALLNRRQAIFSQARRQSRHAALHDVALVVAAIACFIMALAWAWPIIGHQHAALAILGFAAWLFVRQPINVEA